MYSLLCHRWCFIWLHNRIIWSFWYFCPRRGVNNLFKEPVQEQCQNTSGLCSLSSPHRPTRMFSFKFYSPKQTTFQLIEYCWVLSYIDVTKKNLSDTTFINGVFLVLVMQCWGKVYIGTTEHIQNLAEELQNNLQPPSKDNFL